MSRGKDIAEAFLAGETDAVWAEMSPEMKSALGTADALAAVQADMRRDFGSESEVLSERMLRDGPYDVYERTARWTGSATPLQITVALDPDGQVAGLWVRPQPKTADSPYLDYETKTALRLPFDGAWYVYWGGRRVEDNHHAIDAGQRFALDLLVMQHGQSHSGDPAILENYYCWDRPILAPAEGVIVRAVGHLPDQPIGKSDPSNPAGNHVVIDFGNGEYGFLAHLRQGSVTVAEGDQVTTGTEVGRCGNSGNTSEPHLHFHLQTSPSLGHGEGLPAQFLSYLADGEAIENGEPTRGQTVQPIK